MKPRPISDLARWMRDRNYSDAAFAGEIGKRLNRKVSPHTVLSWRLGRAVPRREALKAVIDFTDGEVNAESFILAEKV